jgi:hypothetical protein
MRGGVDAASHPTHDSRAGGCESTAQRRCHSFSVRRRAPRPYNRDGRIRHAGQLTEDEQERRWIAEVEQRRRIVAVANHQESRATTLAVGDRPDGFVAKA